MIAAPTSSQLDPEPKQVQQRFLKFKFNLLANVVVNINNETFYHESSIQLLTFYNDWKRLCKIFYATAPLKQKVVHTNHWVQVFISSQVQQEIELGILKWIRCWKLFPGREFRMRIANKMNKNSICSQASSSIRWNRLSFEISLLRR